MSTNMVHLTINDLPIEVPAGTSILNAARTVGINIPTLCHYDAGEYSYMNNVASCRVCMVEITGRRNLAPACSTQVGNDMVIRTDSPRAVRARRTMVELLLSNHPSDCLVCERNGSCMLQKIAGDLGIRGVKFQGATTHYEKDESSYSLVRNPDKCILCRRCETVCSKVQGLGVYSATGRGFDTTIGTAFDLPMIDTACTFCGQCVSVCPTGALTEVDNSEEVWDLISQDGKVIIAQTAPAIRVALGEEFGMEPGTPVTGKMVSALRRIGFDKVMDTNFAADITILEEASEFLHRLQHGGTLPMITSCCPAWVKFIEHQFPDMLDLPSSCKSPHEMFGALAKTFYADKLGVKPEDIVVVSIMPCLAKKFEAERPELNHQGNSDVDIVLSTRELARMIREAGIDFTSLEDGDFDAPMGVSSGAADIFGSTGGVMEAALRTAYEWVTETKLENVNFEQVRGLAGVRDAEIAIGDVTIKIAIAHGLANVRELLERVRSGEAEYHMIEVMACPGGCISGGGQPYTMGDMEILRKRAAGLYSIDTSKTMRRSHENPDVLRLYEEFIGEVYGAKAHELLHTSYSPRRRV